MLTPPKHLSILPQFQIPTNNPDLMEIIFYVWSYIIVIKLNILFFLKIKNLLSLFFKSILKMAGKLTLILYFISFPRNALTDSKLNETRHVVRNQARGL